MRYNRIMERGRYNRFYGTVIVSGMLILGIILYLQYLGQRIGEVHAPLVDAAMQIKLETALAHLAFEETIGGEKGASPAKVSNHLYRAMWFANVMLQGGMDEEWTYTPLDDDGLRQRISELQTDLQKLDRTLNLSIHSGALLRQGSPLDQQFDATFTTTMQSADVVERALHAVLKEERQRIVGSGTVISILLLGSFVLIHFRRLHKADALRFSRLNNATLTDPLTGIGNRRAFDEALTREWEHAIRTGTYLSLIMIDIDHFKHYNDALGHQAGDRCLQEVVRILSEMKRRSIDTLARYGGEEFCMILPATDSSGAEQVAHKMHRQLADANIDHPGTAVSSRVTISIGIASSAPVMGSSPEAFVAAADQALYRAKREGRNRTAAVETESLDKEVAATLPA